MGLIAVEGMHFFAYHGYYEEEQISGNEYIADVYIGTDFKKAALADRLQDTINYEKIYAVVDQIMNQKIRLLETIAERIVERLKQLFTNIQTLKVRISKLRPPMGSKIDRTFIEVEYDFQNKCPKCKKKLLCYTDQQCWCQNISLNSETRTMLNDQYNGCLCQDCLKFYANS